MGASLPAMSRWVEATPAGVQWLGYFYGGNIAGAVFGCLFAGFYLLRVYDMAVWMVIAGLIGARLLYVWENYQLFAGALQKIFLVNEGGISQWGGIFGALLGGYIWCRRQKVDSCWMTAATREGSRPTSAALELSISPSGMGKRIRQKASGRWSPISVTYSG